MHRLATLFIAALLSFVSIRAFAAADTVLRVRIAHSDSEISLTGLNLRLQANDQVLRLGGGSIRPALISSTLGSLTLKPELAGGLIRWSIIEKNSGRVLRRMNGEVIKVDGEMIRLSGAKPAPNQISLRATFTKIRPNVDVVANLNLEDYLKGVLPHEMPADWPAEALKAQAVASRTYALQKMRERERAHKFYHLESTVMDQVYNWLLPSAAEDEKQAAVIVALDETRGEVLTDKAGEPFAAYFHADCGGSTEEATEVWGPQEKKLGTAIDSSCPFSPMAKWTWAVSSSEIYARVRTALKLPWEGDVRELAITDFTPSGRAAKLALITAEGERHMISGAQFRSLLGFDRLRSTKFEISKQINGQFVFNGRGYGHGVGMCQWGAKKLASSGTSYREILKHYYPKAQLSVVE